jgi:predicted CXXCH cytochrome family protein
VRRAALLLGVIASLALPHIAAGGEAGRVPLPPIPKAAKGDACIRDVPFMRRNHMAMLKHKRDDTVHGGDRTADASLKECVECHAVAGADGKAVTIEDPRHFCRACHDYAAVKVDCFECHASRPENPQAAGIAPTDEIAALSGWLKEATR